MTTAWGAAGRARGGNNGIAEHLAPFGKAVVGGQDHRAFFVARINELEEEIAAALDDRQVANFVDNKERGAAEPTDALVQAVLALGLGEVPTISARMAK